MSSKYYYFSMGPASEHERKHDVTVYFSPSHDVGKTQLGDSVIFRDFQLTFNTEVSEVRQVVTTSRTEIFEICSILFHEFVRSLTDLYMIFVFETAGFGLLIFNICCILLRWVRMMMYIP